MVNHALTSGFDGLTQEGRQETHAVFGHIWGFFSRDVRSRGKEVHQGDELVAAGACFGLTRPADDERNPMPSIPEVGLRSPEMGADVVAMFAQVGNISALRGAIVAGEDQQGVICETILFQRVRDGSDGGIRLHDKVGMGSQAAFAQPLFVGQNGIVR